MVETPELSYIEKIFLEASKNLIKEIESQVCLEGYRVDFLLPGERIVIELDGHEFHKSQEQRVKDATRDRHLTQKGYHVIRFTGSEVNRDVKACVQEVLNIKESIRENRVLPEKPTELYFCVRMQEVISHFIEKFNQSFDEEHPLILKDPNNFYMPLAIEKVDTEVISVSHYFIEAGDVVYNPRIEFYIYKHGGGEWRDWTPVSITDFVLQFVGDYFMECARIDEKGIEVLDIELQRDIANRAENWARLLGDRINDYLNIDY